MKMHNTWNMVALGGLPMLICYVAAKDTLAFFAVCNVGGVPVSTQVGPTFKFSSMRDRIRIIQYSLNACRLMVLFRGTMPAHVPQLHVPVSRCEGRVRVTVNIDHVKKVIKSGSTAPPSLYELMSTKHDVIKNAIKISDISVDASGVTTLRMVPIGSQVLPSDVAELKKAILCVLNCLHCLHTQSPAYNHRDVRWPNILKGADGWFLIDFETAACEGQVVTWVDQRGGHPPEAVNKKPWTSSSDIWQVGRLLQDWGQQQVVALDSSGLSFVLKLMQEDPASRPSAAQALGDEWLKL
jgi:serine/threonine protein kinase